MREVLVKSPCVLLAACFVLVSCIAVTMIPTAALKHEGTTVYKDDTFTMDAIRSGGVALFPVTGGNDCEDLRRAAEDAIERLLPIAVPSGRVLGKQAAMDLLSSHERVSFYEPIITTYHKTGIIDLDEARSLRSLLGVRYALMCDLQSIVREKEFGVFKTTLLSHCLVVDLDTGNVAQEITTETYYEVYVHKDSYSKKQLRMITEVEHAELIAKDILSQLPGSQIPAGKR